MNNIHNILLVIQTILSLLLIAAILLQPQGASSGVMWGAASQSYHTRRGFEKVLHYFTYVGVVLFVVIGLVILKTA